MVEVVGLLLVSLSKEVSAVRPDKEGDSFGAEGGDGVLGLVVPIIL